MTRGRLRDDPSARRLYLVAKRSLRVLGPSFPSFACPEDSRLGVVTSRNRPSRYVGCIIRSAEASRYRVVSFPRLKPRATAQTAPQLLKSLDPQILRFRS